MSFRLSPECVEELEPIGDRLAGVRYDTVELRLAEPVSFLLGIGGLVRSAAARLRVPKSPCHPRDPGFVIHV